MLVLFWGGEFGNHLKKVIQKFKDAQRVQYCTYRKREKKGSCFLNRHNLNEDS